MSSCNAVFHPSTTSNSTSVGVELQSSNEIIHSQSPTSVTISASPSTSTCSSSSSSTSSLPLKFGSSSSVPSVDEVISCVKDLYCSYGNSDYIGESISQVEHGLQCAYFADAAKAPPAVIIASLFHDIGQLVGLERHLPEMPGNVGICKHELVGSEYLKAAAFPSLTCQLVARHVDAKRYFTATNAAYHKKLSAASKLTLIEQGGPMSAEEVRRFEQDPLKKWILLMRTWDDKAKIVNFKVPPFEDYIPMIRKLLEEERVQRKQLCNTPSADP